MASESILNPKRSNKYGKEIIRRKNLGVFIKSEMVVYFFKYFENSELNKAVKMALINGRTSEINGAFFVIFM